MVRRINFRPIVNGSSMGGASSPDGSRFYPRLGVSGKRSSAMLDQGSCLPTLNKGIRYEKRRAANIGKRDQQSPASHVVLLDHQGCGDHAWRNGRRLGDDVAQGGLSDRIGYF